MRKLYIILFTFLNSYTYADTTGFYLGGGIGYGMQNLSITNLSSLSSSPALRAIAGFQLTSWASAEVGYTYISQGPNWLNLGRPSTTVYDLTFLPGFSIPLTPVTVYARLGINSLSPNLNSSWYNQIFGTMSANFEIGAGVKVEIPMTNTFLRLEYINFGGASNNNNGALNVVPSIITMNAGYIF